MSQVTITLPNGKKKNVEKGTTPQQVAEQIGKKLAKDTVAAKVDGEAWDADRPIEKDAKLELVTIDTLEGLQVLWHSTSHVMAEAVLALFPGTKLTLGPPTKEGFYYDFDSKHNFTPEDFSKIESKMKEIIKKDSRFKRTERPLKKMLALFKDNKYKCEMIKEQHEKGNPLTIYTDGKFTDFCKGPHAPSTRFIKAFKLMKVAGAYWRGNEKNKMLQRIYGISYPSTKQLDEFLTRKEEAEKRNHLKLGKELDLFSVHEEGPGFVFIHAKGQHIWNSLVTYWMEEHHKLDYQAVNTPLIMRKELWEQSGHWEHYRENMYFTKVEEGEFAVKPMNCPGHILLFKEKRHSYRDLPIKICEFGIVHRHERSGVLSGLFRVRKFTQDDAHLFITPQQIEGQVIEIIGLTDRMYKTTGFKKYHIELSTRPEKAMGTKAQWDKAEAALEAAVKKTGRPYKINEGDGAFYGPKLDFHIEDAIGRTWQCATIQLDFQMPEKFDLHYVDEHDKLQRPAMIHRVIFGSMERFLGVLIEHYAGAFPVWLAPVQARVLSISERHNTHAEKVHKALKEQGLRSELDARNESISYKVREAQLQKIPYILAVGDKEAKEGTVAVRTRDGKTKHGVKVAAFIKLLAKENAERT